MLRRAAEAVPPTYSSWVVPPPGRLLFALFFRNAPQCSPERRKAFHLIGLCWGACPALCSPVLPSGPHQKGSSLASPSAGYVHVGPGSQRWWPLVLCPFLTQPSLVSTALTRF